MSKKRETIQLPEFVSSRVAAQVLGVTPQTLRRWARKGQIGSIRTPGGQFRYCLGPLIVAATPAAPPQPQKLRATRKEPLQVALSEKIPAQNAKSAEPAQLDLVEMVKATPLPAVISAEALRHQIERLASSSHW
jgi:excisionase family DNA binding protein